MAEVTVSADPSYGPPRNVIVAHATGGSILESCEVTRIVGGVEEPIRQQPIVGVSDVTLYDYEAPYDRSSVYRIQGLERSTLSTQWTGDKNASTSTLSQDGAVVATNLILSPLPRAMDYVTYDATHAGSPTLSDQPDGMKLTSNESHNPSAYKNGHTLPAGSYHLHAELSEVSGTKWNDFMLGFFGYITPYPSALSHGIVDYDATFTDDMPSKNFELKCPTDGYAVWRHVGLYTASDWQAMQALGVTWFDGDSFQAGTTTQYAESSSPVTLSPDSGWLIHPGNPAKSMRLPLGHITGMGDTTRRSNATRHDILGARYPIYTNPGPRYSRELSMKLRTRTADDENMLDALLDDQTPILFNPRGVDASRLNLNPMYLQVGDVTAARYAQSLYPTSDSPQHWRDWTLPCTQVDSPAVSQQAVGWTYARLLNDNTRYQSVIISYKDYASLQAHSVKDGQ